MFYHIHIDLNISMDIVQEFLEFQQSPCSSLSILEVIVCQLYYL